MFTNIIKLSFDTYECYDDIINSKTLAWLLLARLLLQIFVLHDCVLLTDLLKLPWQQYLYCDMGYPHSINHALFKSYSIIEASKMDAIILWELSSEIPKYCYQCMSPPWNTPKCRYMTPFKCNS